MDLDISDLGIGFCEEFHTTGFHLQTNDYLIVVSIFGKNWESNSCKKAAASIFKLRLLGEEKSVGFILKSANVWF